MQLNLAKKSFYFSLIIFFSSFTFLLVSLLALPTDKACDRRRIIFSPLQDVISYKWVNYGDYFFPRSVYRTPVTRPIALDTQLAWQDLAKDFEISIPEQKLESLRQSTDYQWKRHSDGGIAANVAVFHQLSCLSTIRLHAQADLNDPWRQESRERVDQCLELLRHKFMCDADATPFLLKNNPHVIRGDSPDMGTKHKCRNYDAVVSWLNQNARQT